MLRKRLFDWILHARRSVDYLSTSPYVSLIGKCCKNDDIESATQLFDEIERDGVQLSSASYSSLLYLFGKHGRVDAMLRVKTSRRFASIEPDEPIYTNLIAGLARARRIDEAVGVLTEMRAHVEPKARTYNALIGCAAQLGRESESHRLHDEMRTEYDLLPDGDALAALVAVTTNSKSIAQLGEDFRASERRLPSQTLASLKQWFLREKMNAVATRINNDGSCQACGLTLESIELPPERKAALVKKTASLLAGFESEATSQPGELAFENGNDSRIDKVTTKIEAVKERIARLESKLAYEKEKEKKLWHQQLSSCRFRLAALQSLLPPTLSRFLKEKNLTAPSPEQVRDFKTWMNEIGSCDVVVDGLNVAHFFQTGTDAWLVHGVVEHYRRIGKRTIVIFRDHLKKNRRHVEPLRRIAEKCAGVYFIGNRQADDYFFLYAALYGGLDVELVSNDLMRDHRQLYRGPLYDDFLKWQRGHQVTIRRFEKDNRPVFQPRQLHDVITQWTENNWHFPGENDNWLCVTKELSRIN